MLENELHPRRLQLWRSFEARIDQTLQKSDQKLMRILLGVLLVVVVGGPNFVKASDQKLWVGPFILDDSLKVLGRQA